MFLFYLLIYVYYVWDSKNLTLILTLRHGNTAWYSDNLYIIFHKNHLDYLVHVCDIILECNVPFMSRNTKNIRTKFYFQHSVCPHTCIYRNTLIFLNFATLFWYSDLLFDGNSTNINLISRHFNETKSIYKNVRIRIILRTIPFIIHWCYRSKSGPKWLPKENGNSIRAILCPNAVS